jgi:CubicO group peptidase (beta-lactamase class C family)
LDGAGSLDDAERRLSDGFHGVVMAHRDGQQVYARAFGMADVSQGVPNRLDRRFRIGSITKTFTTELVHQLAEEGRLSLEDPLSRYVSGIAGGGRIRLVDLIEHRSGLDDFTDRDWQRLLLSSPRLQPSQVLDTLRARRLKREPDRRFEYNNAGYLLLGRVIEAVTRQSYADALRDRILGPASLHDTGLAAFDDEVRDLSVGHGPNARPDPARYDHGAIDSAGGLYSTAGDLLSWCEVQHTRQRTRGWRQGERFGRVAVWHTGNTNAYSALLVRVPDVRGCYAVLSNVGRVSPPRDILRTLPGHFFGPAPSQAGVR